MQLIDDAEIKKASKAAMELQSHLRSAFDVNTGKLDLNKFYTSIKQAGKDLDYLSDMFEWNYIAMKKTNDMVNKTQDEDIKKILEKGCNLFDQNMKEVINILNNGGKNE